jgi:hypothetical protein
MGRDNYKDIFQGGTIKDDLMAETGDAKQQVDNFVANNPDRAEAVIKLYDIPDITEQEILDYINLNYK